VKKLAKVWAVSWLLMNVSDVGAACPGDCDNDGRVTVAELVRGVSIALGHAALDTCLTFDGNADGAITVEELVGAVNNALHGCVAPSTRTPSPPATPTLVVVPTEPAVESQLNIVLGRPTDTSIAVSVLADPGTEVYFEYGTTPGTYGSNTIAAQSSTGEPIVTEITNLTPNTRYYYRAHYRHQGEADYRTDSEHSFHTQRAAGSTFSFGVQGDSHPEREGKMFNPDLYALNMRNVAARQPDFYFGLGDDFSIERLLERNLLTQGNVNQVYLNQRGFFGIMGNSTALFLVNGNHEQAAGYLLGDRYETPYDNAPIYAGKARVTYFPLPAADGFYSADTQEVPGVGWRRDYYAWEWGDALFVTIDPYWHSPVPVDSGVPGVGKATDPWEITMGDAQYAWFKKTLEESRARYKFVFEHHVLGGGRGGASIVHSYEWGGYDRNGQAYEFRSRRPSWDKPIHQLMDEHKVAIFFFGHDHLFAREKVDGVIYQSVPNPADNTYTAFNSDAYDPSTITLPGASYDPDYGVIMPNSGYLHVTVSPEDVTVAYVRAVLPGDESRAGSANDAVAISYSASADPHQTNAPTATGTPARAGTATPAPTSTPTRTPTRRGT